MQLITSLRAALPGVIAVLPFVCYGFLALVFGAGIVRLLLLARATTLLRQHVRSLRSVDYRRFQDSEHVMPVSLILPAATEKSSIRELVENLLDLEFKQYELIIVANSENAMVWNELLEHYQLLPFRQPFKKTIKGAAITAVYRSASDVRLIVLDSREENRASALNAGVNFSSYPVIAPVYPDLRLTKDALLKMVYAFVSDPACVFIGSFARVGLTAEGEAYGKMPVRAQQQSLERLRTMYTNRAGYATIGLYLPQSNTFCAFLKSAVMEAGGFSAEARAEGADLLLRIHARLRKEKRAYCAKLLPDAVCVQLPQKRMRGICADIRKGQREMRGTISKNRTVARTLHGSAYTRFAEKTWPFVELIGILIILFAALLGAISPMLALLYLLLGALLGAVQSVLAVLLEEYAFQQKTDTGLLLGRYTLAILDNFCYRLRTTLVRIFS